jgi:ATP-dependent Lhr-like helicase
MTDKARSPLAPFHPLVRGWFRDTLGAPSAPQKEGWPAIAAGDHTLILAPTGTGKTLAAFLWELNQLIVRGLAAPLPNAVQILYISPLKALNNDVQRNLELPLAQLAARFTATGTAFPELRVAVRTGDTSRSARARMLRKAPHILITTPESLHILLTSVRGRGMFSGVGAVIVDEIHAIAGTKRGSHLALTLERLERLCASPPQRIGLSATQKPLHEVARFLAGEGRTTRVVDCGLVKQMRTVIRSPVDDLNHVPAGTIWPAVAPLVLTEIRAARTTLVFVNNRGQAERMAARVNALAGEELALPYHGSLSRERRLVLEESLKAGTLRALVSTSSLELGIDIGSVDVVLQIQSPKRVSSGLQRIGRAGHSLGAISRGTIIPTFRDDALEAVAVASAMRDGDVEPTTVVQNALDVLAQIVVAAVSVDDDWTRDGLLAMVRRAYPYHALADSAFDEVLEMLSGKYPADVAAELDARITWDRITGLLSAPPASRMIAVISGGTIPDRGLYTVNLPDRTRIGELDEEFVHESRIGDAFQLGSSTWRVQSIEHDRVIVTPAPGAPARMPFWHGDYGARAPHLAQRVGTLRRQLAQARTPERVAALMAAYDADEPTIRSLVDYVDSQRVATTIVPDERALVVEQFHDETDALRLVVHTPFGGRVNAPWGMALAHRVREWLADTAVGGSSRRHQESPRFEIQVQTSDDGIMLRLPSLDSAIPLAVIRDLGPSEAEERLLHEVGGSSLFGARFRMNAARALLLPRGNPRRRMPLWLQRLKALDLLQAVRAYPSFPMLVETYRDVLTDAFDLPALTKVLRAIHTGDITMQASSTTSASPFAGSLQFGFVMDWLYADDAPRAEQRAALLSLDRALLADVMGTDAVDAETLLVLRSMLDRRLGIAPGSRARTADELSILIDRAGDLSLADAAARVADPDEGRRGDPLGELLAQRRLVALDLSAADNETSGGEPRLLLAENVPRYLAAYGDTMLESLRAGNPLTAVDPAVGLPEAFRRATLTRGAARREILSRFIALSGVVSIDDVRARYPFEALWIRDQLDEWVRSGRLVRGAFGFGDRVPRYASARLVEQARRRELARARRAVEAVDLSTYARFLQHWQHLSGEPVLDGDEGVATALGQLSGVARPTEWWERHGLPGRVRATSRSAVDRLLASGEIAWAAVPIPKPAESRVGPVRFFRRGTGRGWLAQANGPTLSSQGALLFATIRDSGASFFEDLLAITGMSSRHLRDTLRELVAAGLITSDSMQGLTLAAGWRPALPSVGPGERDPTRWIPIPGDPQGPVIQRRPSGRRLRRWRRPDIEGAEPERWPGRWSLVHTPGVLGPVGDESRWAEVVARQWLERYGVVSREHWRREHPAMPWQAIYRELRRLEMRGEARRGYFVHGLTGAQFAHPAAVDRLREEAATDDIVVMSAGDPANAYRLVTAPPPAATRNVRSTRHSVVATLSGTLVLFAESGGRSLNVQPGSDHAVVGRAARAVAEYLIARSGRPRDVVVDTIDGGAAGTSRWSLALVASGFRRASRALRFYRGI